LFRLIALFRNKTSPRPCYESDVAVTRIELQSLIRVDRPTRQPAHLAARLPDSAGAVFASVEGLSAPGVLSTDLQIEATDSLDGSPIAWTQVGIVPWLNAQASPGAFQVPLDAGAWVRWVRWAVPRLSGGDGLWFSITLLLPDGICQMTEPSAQGARKDE
jgi:hypothetical protein